MGINTDAEVRYGVVIPEEVDDARIEDLVEDVDGLEVIRFGDYEWADDDLPTLALVLTDPKVRCGEYGVKKFMRHELSAPAYAMDKAQIAGQKIARELWDGNWIADVGYLLVWSRG